MRIDGGPDIPAWSFPSKSKDDMTLRDYFAAKAMHALLVCPGGSHFGGISAQAYDIADRMLKEREK